MNKNYKSTPLSEFVYLNFTDNYFHKCLKDYLLDFKQNLIHQLCISVEDVISFPLNNFNFLANDLKQSISCSNGIYCFSDQNHNNRYVYCEVENNRITKAFIDSGQLNSLSELINEEKNILYNNLAILENKLEHANIENYIIDDCIENFESGQFRYAISESLICTYISQNTENDNLEKMDSIEL